jgi:acyl carrier protein
MPASLHDTIAAAIRSVLSDTGRSAREIRPASLLAGDLGLDSLDLAQTIVILERTLGVDPFRLTPSPGARPRLRTFADLCGAYENLPPDDPPASPSDSSPPDSLGQP